MQEGLTQRGEIVTGYKATDVNMRCRGFQFEVGKWYEHDGEIEQCVSGFHFCEYPSGPWAYYPKGRIFKCEAEFVLKSNGPGADIKHVAKRIRLVEEIIVTGDRNTGDRNTGDRNTGDGNVGHGNPGDGNTGDRNVGHRNTGDRNTGHWNTGDGNTGDRNTGHGNTGNGNTGDGNTGDRNTGHWNTGDRNTGDRNVGHRNTGHWNTGHRNTGRWNTGNGNTGDGNTGHGNVGCHHAGCLNCGEAPFYIFDKPARREDVDMDLVEDLARLLMDDMDIDPSPFLSLPNATKEAIKKLHDAHKKARRERQGLVITSPSTIDRRHL